MSTKINVLWNRCLIKRDNPDETTESGIIIPQRYQDKQLTGTVIVVGTDVTQIKVQDKVLVEKFGGDDVSVDGQEYLLVNEQAVLMVLSEGQ